MKKRVGNVLGPVLPTALASYALYELARVNDAALTPQMRGSLYVGTGAFWLFCFVIAVREVITLKLTRDPRDHYTALTRWLVRGDVHARRSILATVAGVVFILLHIFGVFACPGGFPLWP